MTRFRKPVLALAAALTAGLFVACSDSPTEPGNSPLAGLTQREGSDSTGKPLPPPPANPTPGGFHGLVLGPSAPGSGNDTLATAPRIAGVVVTAYPVTGGTYANPTLGPAEQSVTTGADGKFQLTLSGGEYVVTFNPPASSIYGGVWVTATTSENSNDWPWWVTLWKK